MFFSHLFLIIFFHLFSERNCQNTKTFELKLNQTITNINEELGVSYFNLTIDANEYNYDLMITVKPMDIIKDFSDPDIFISKTNPYPSKSSNQWKSTALGQDFISICPHEAQHGDTFYIAVNCDKKCSFQIEARLEKEYILTKNEELNLFLKKNEKKMFKFTTDSSELDKISVFSYSVTFSNFQMYVAIESLPSSENSLETTPYFLGGYIVHIQNPSNLTEKSCGIYVLLVAEEESSINLGIKVLNEISKIKLNQPNYGVANANTSYCYQLDYQNNVQNDSLILLTNLYSGLGDLYISNESISNSVNNNVLKYNIDENLSVKLNNSHLMSSQNGNNSNSSVLYICIKANFSASFSLIPYYQSESNKVQLYNRLISGISSYGILPSNDVTTYRILDYGIGTDNSISLNVISGSPILSYFYCNNTKYCIVTPSEYENQKSKYIISDNINQKQTVSINDKDNLCHQQYSLNNTIVINNDCYVLAIVKCEGNTECTYQILNINKANEILLVENTPFSRFVGENQTDYYKIIVPKNNEINRITIILNSHNGDSNLYTSREYSRPNVTNYDKASTFKSFSPDIVTYNNDHDHSLAGVYYIGVLGSSLSYYTLIYYTNYMDKGIYNPIYLSNGLLVKDFLNCTETSSNFKLFAFEIQELKFKTAGIIISLNADPIQHLSMFVYESLNDVRIDESSGTMINYAYYSNESEIKIFKDKTSSVYYIFVVLNRENVFHRDKNIDIVNFYISAVYKGDNIVLNEGVSSIMTLDESNMFQGYTYFQRDVADDIDININLFYGRVTLYADLDTIHENNFSATYKKTFTTVGRLKIASSYLKLCQKDTCFLYIYLKREEDCQYIINISSNTLKPQDIFKGYSLSRSIYPGDYQYYTTYFFDKDEYAILNLNNVYGNSSLFAKVYEQKDGLVDVNNIKMPFRNETSFEPIYTMDGSSIELSNKGGSCNPCLMIIGVYGETNYYNHENKYTINYVGKTLKIMLNQLHSSSIKKKKFDYFTFSFPKSASTLYITLSNMNGDADLYMNYGGSYPTLENYHWKSATTFNEIIDIDQKDNFFTNKNITSLNGLYIIGVYGYTSTSYSLYVTSHKKKLKMIDNDHSAIGQTKIDNDYVYFVYKNLYHKIEPENFSILLCTNFLYGQGTVYAKLQNLTQIEIYQQLPDEKDYTWSTHNQQDKNFLNINLNRSYLLQHGNIDSSHIEVSLMISILCEEKCYLNLLGTSQTFLNEKYLHQGIPSLVYLEKDRKIDLKYNYLNSGKLLYTATLFRGEAAIKIVELKDNSSMSISEYEMNYINNNKNLRLYPILDYKVNQSSYYSIEVKAKENTAIMVKMSKEDEITNFSIENSFMANQLIFSSKKKIYKGFFQLVDNIQYVNVHLQPRFFNRNLRFLKVYAKLRLVQKSFLEDHYSNFPSENDYDFKDSMNILLNSMTMVLPGVKLSQNNDLLPIYLLTIELDMTRFNSLEIYMVDILINPIIKEVQRYQLKPLSGLVSRISVMNPPIYQIFDLMNSETTESKVVVSISECKGKVNFRVSDVIGNEEESDFQLATAFHYRNGKYTSSFMSNKKKFFLTVIGKEGVSQESCEINEKLKKSCTMNNVADYLVEYKLYSEDNFVQYETGNEGILNWKRVENNAILLNWDPVYLIRMNGVSVDREKVGSNRFFIYQSEKLEDFTYMQSICFLTIHTDLVVTQVSDLYDYKLELETGKKYYITILSVFNGNHLSYVPIQVNIDPINFYKNPFYIIPIMVAIVTLLIISFYFWKKYKITKEKLDSEVKEISVVVADGDNNITSQEKDYSETKAKSLDKTGGIEFTKNLKYGSLKEENDN